MNAVLYTPAQGKLECDGTPGQMGPVPAGSHACRRSSRGLFADRWPSIRALRCFGWWLRLAMEGYMTDLAVDRRQRWAAFSVRAHRDIGSLAADVLLYDRIILPV